MKKVNPLKCPINVRVWAKGRVRRLSLVDGQEIHFRSFEYTDEGWSSTDEYIYRTGMAIYLYVVNDGRDCDGRLTREWSGKSEGKDLHCVRRPHGKKWGPKRLALFDTILSCQRDFTAESMGY